MTAARSDLMALAERRCASCKRVKPITEFRIWKKGDTRRPSSLCDECRRASYKTPEYRSAQNARMARDRALGKRKQPDLRHARSREANHPEKIKAKRLVRTAIAAGKLIKPRLCEVCKTEPPPLRDGRSGLQAHHADYSKPLDVRWLCHPCHVLEHKNEERRVKPD